MRKAPPTSEEIAKMCAAIRHRGPDATGIGLYGPAAMGSTRLKVIDLSETANQPMSNEVDTVHVVFNGEIYNFQELREDLVRRGHTFRTHSDTEVLVHLYEDLGTEFAAKLDGMFALAIWDERSRCLVLARDRAGKKPLFYFHNEQFFAFGSEIKAMLTLEQVPACPAHEYLPTYLSFGYVPCPHTLYKEIHQLPPGHVGVLRANGSFHSSPFWQLRIQPDESITLEDACEEVRSLAFRAVKKRLISDVPLGVLLSGGMDSSIVAGLASQAAGTVKSFCATFPDDPDFDEASFARIAARHFGTEHHELEIRPQSSDLIETLVYHHDQPFMDSSAVPTYLISRLARQHVTVALNGDGGDELFAGYLRFVAMQIGEQLPRWFLHMAGFVSDLPILSRLVLSRRVHRFARNSLQPIAERYLSYVTFFPPSLDGLIRPEVAQTAVHPLTNYRLTEEEARGCTPLGMLLHLNYREYLLNDLNVKMDRCTMANSLEARSPFLDTALTEFAARLPDRFKLHGFSTKFILKRAFRDLLPREILRRGKMGFGVPLERWFRNDSRDLIRDLLLSPSARVNDFLVPSDVKGFVVAQLAGHSNWSHHLWLLLTLEIWLRSHEKLFSRPLENSHAPLSVRATA